MISRTCRHPAIARSLRFMADHWRRSITVGDLAKVSAMSRHGTRAAIATSHPAASVGYIRAMLLSPHQQLLGRLSLLHRSVTTKVPAKIRHQQRLSQHSDADASFPSWFA